MPEAMTLKNKMVCTGAFRPDLGQTWFAAYPVLESPVSSCKQKSADELNRSEISILIRRRLPVAWRPPSVPPSVPPRPLASFLNEREQRSLNKCYLLFFCSGANPATYYLCFRGLQLEEDSVTESILLLLKILQKEYLQISHSQALKKGAEGKLKSWMISASPGEWWLGTGVDLWRGL